MPCHTVDFAVVVSQVDDVDVAKVVKVVDAAVDVDVDVAICCNSILLRFRCFLGKCFFFLTQIRF